MQVAREPPERVGWKGGLHETFQQQVMGYSIKGLRKIYCQRHCAAEGGGFLCLKPDDMEWEIESRAVVADRWGLKPCCVGTVWRCSLRMGRRSLSNTLAVGERREMGR